MKKTKIDKLGRIVVPVAYRKRFHITENTELLISCNERNISISPSSNLCKLCEKEIASNAEIQLCKSCIDKITVIINSSINPK